MASTLKRKNTVKYIYRSAITGRVVTKAWAERHPSTTVKEQVTAKKRKRP